MPVLETSADQKYARGLPTVSFRVISDDKSLLIPAGVHSEQSRSYGYNDFSDFERPEHYIRHIEPIESELAVQVEYDMDEQDQEWLDTLNAERKKDQSGPISYEVFEIIMDKLEKEWFNLASRPCPRYPLCFCEKSRVGAYDVGQIKQIPQPASHLPVEDSKCSICDDGEGENSNAIVFCDGCNLAVHQDCYGVPYIPEGQWLCRKCTVSPENPVPCLFCPNEGGAFKQTSTGHWAHLLCAIWIPELTVGNAIYMEPVEGVEAVPKNRWKLICSLCRERVGACIQCDNRNCFTAFHVTCARQMGLLMSMKSVGTNGSLSAFCDKHIPADSQDEDDNDAESTFSQTPARHPQPRGRQGSHTLAVPVTTKSARAHAKSYRPGPPIVPNVIIRKLLDYVGKVSIRKRQPFIERLCRYWSLKREARRGAPLLKRLHLEPWTASNAARQQTEGEKAKKLQFLVLLRNDLEKVRMLAELVRKREKEKLRQSQVIKDVVDTFIIPHYSKLRLTLEKISAMDRNEFFLHPVNKAEVPDYFTVITEPMCWLLIDEKLERNAYLTVEDFKQNIQLVLTNAMLYNKNDSPFHRVAKRIHTNAQPLLEELNSITRQFQCTMPTGNDIAVSVTPADLVERASGDLEPSLILLQSLVAYSTHDAARDHLASIFAFALEKPKPPTPPPPTPPPPKLRKHVSAADRKQRWGEREAAAKERAIASRSTRAVKAMARAFAKEAGVQPSSDIETSGASRPTSSPSRGLSSRRKSMRNEPPSTVIEEGSEHSGQRYSRLQRGVAGVEAVAILSDKERRELERQMDIVTENVDSQDQFRRFNVGWVLPEGSKRRRSERPPDPGPSRPPVLKLSLSTSRNGRAPAVPDDVDSAIEVSRDLKMAPFSLSPLTSPLTDESKESTAPAKGADKTRSAPRPSRARVSNISARDKPEPTSGRSKRKAEDAEETPNCRSKRSKVVTEDDEITPVPKLTTPTPAASAPSNGKSGRQHDDEDEPMTPIPSSDEIIAVLSRSGRQKTKSQVDQDEDVGEDEKIEEIEERDEVEEKEDKGDDEDDSEDPYPAGTLVWAKLYSFPYFPAEVIDPVANAEKIPPSVFQSRASFETQNLARSGRTWLVRFFDTNASYGWIPASRLDMLGEDDAADQIYLAGKEKGEKGKSKGFKTSHLKKACRKGYREALAQMAVDGEKEDSEEDREGE